jgi:plasmid stabilization system protein ParE
VAKRIVYSDKAFADIDRIIEFNNFRNKSTTYSRKFVAGLKKRLSKLLKHPLSGMKTDDADVLLLIWDNYYVFYRPNDNAITILGIYHQKENILR